MSQLQKLFHGIVDRGSGLSPLKSYGIKRMPMATDMAVLCSRQWDARNLSITWCERQEMHSRTQCSGEMCRSCICFLTSLAQYIALVAASSTRGKRSPNLGPVNVGMVPLGNQDLPF